MSKTERIAAGVMAGATAAGGGVAPLKNYDTDKGVNNDVPAIYQEVPPTNQTPEQIVADSVAEQGFTISNPQEVNQENNTPQKIGVLGDYINKQASDAYEAEDNAKENQGLDNALKTEQVQEPPPEKQSEPNQSADSSQAEDNGNGYDYYNGIM